MKDINNGNIDPDIIFNNLEIPDELYSNMEYPIDCFLSEEGNFDINSIVGEGSRSYLGLHPSKEYELLHIEATNIIKFMYSNNDFKIKKLYYYQLGSNDENDWIIICKTINDFYVYFIASCSYTGFDAYGEGSFCYNINWKQFWDVSLSAAARQDLLCSNNYEHFKINPI
jgi:hypothetical protein